jgi:hypothetical protein
MISRALCLTVSLGCLLDACIAAEPVAETATSADGIGRDGDDGITGRRASIATAIATIGAAADPTTTAAWTG